MDTASQIKFLTHKQIDKAKWDECVRTSPQSLVYNYSWCLDAVAEHWDALVLNNYDTILPLVWKRKYGLQYLSQPYFAAQVGITGIHTDTATTDSFLQAIPSRFKFIDINLDEKNKTILFAADRIKRVNMLLDTTKTYPEVAANYHRLAGRMIHRAVGEQLFVEANADIKEGIAFYRQHYQGQLKLPRQAYNKLTEMLTAAAQQNQLIALVAKKDKKMMGVYFLLTDKEYAYSVMGGSSPEGKQKGVFHLLTDYALKTTCGKGLRFRFEGSDLPGIAQFNQQFGAVPFYYDHLKINRLPAFLKSFKK